MWVQVAYPYYCSHPHAVPVTLHGQTVAARCPACETNLPAAWLTCPHERTIDTSVLNEIPGRTVCNGCGVTYWDGDKHELARFLKSRRVSLVPSNEGREHSEG